jgi:hypothetical protein
MVVGGVISEHGREVGGVRQSLGWMVMRRGSRSTTKDVGDKWVVRVKGGIFGEENRGEDEPDSEEKNQIYEFTILL